MQYKTGLLIFILYFIPNHMYNSASKRIKIRIKILNNKDNYIYIYIYISQYNNKYIVILINQLY